jgi:hypothetical protein
MTLRLPSVVRCLQSQDNARDLSHAEWLALLLARS